MNNEDSIAKQVTVQSNPVIFFDGVCGLCNRFVVFLFSIDRAEVFKVATLQGPYSNRTLPKNISKGLDSLVVLTESGEMLTKSRAVLFILRRVGGVWRFLGLVGGLLPMFVSDKLYDLLSRNRYNVFGRLESCQIAKSDGKSRFID